MRTFIGLSAALVALAACADTFKAEADRMADETIASLSEGKNWTSVQKIAPGEKIDGAYAYEIVGKGPDETGAEKTEYILLRITKDCSEKPCAQKMTVEHRDKPFLQPLEAIEKKD